jgi:hypothetical protein
MPTLKMMLPTCVLVGLENIFTEPLPSIDKVISEVRRDKQTHTAKLSHKPRFSFSKYGKRAKIGTGEFISAS